LRFLSLRVSCEVWLPMGCGRQVEFGNVVLAELSEGVCSALVLVAEIVHTQNQRELAKPRTVPSYSFSLINEKEGVPQGGLCIDHRQHTACTDHVMAQYMQGGRRKRLSSVMR
jgi:hypothetical protein